MNINLMNNFSITLLTVWGKGSIIGVVVALMIIKSSSSIAGIQSINM